MSSANPSTQVNRHDTPALREMRDLRCEYAMVAGPAVDQQKRRALRHIGSHFEMREPHALTRQEPRLQVQIDEHRESSCQRKTSDRTNAASACRLATFRDHSRRSSAGRRGPVAAVRAKRSAGRTIQSWAAIAATQKASMTIAIDRAERPSNSQETKALDDAAPII
jgi:hypothetical protein